MPESRLRKIRVGLYALAGSIAGAVVAFLTRPADAAVGQLALDTVVTRGVFLRGAEAAFAPLAQASFNYLMVGLAAGALLAGALRHFTLAKH